MKFKELANNYQIDVDSFQQAKADYYEYCNPIDNPNFSKEKADQAFERICDKLEELLDIFAKQTNVKEEGGFCVSHIADVIPKAAFETQTSKFEVTIGLFREYYIAMELKNPHNIKFMKDDFWWLLFQLSELGDFSFKEGEKPTKNMRVKHPQLFNKTGDYYKLMRNYFLYEVEYAQIRTLGYLSVTWESNLAWEVLIIRMLSVFTIFYKLHLLLWKQDNKGVKL